MKITIFQAGLVPEDINEQFSGYGEMIADLIDKPRQNFDFEVISLLEGDQVPAIDDVEALAISGSPLGVYDDVAWLPALRELVQQAYAKSVPMFGICFGHQLIADALGGDVRKSEKGWGLGRQTYKVHDLPDFMQGVPEEMQFSVVHQDQVITPPQSAKIVGGNDFAPAAILNYENGAAFSIQAHPEFADTYTRALLNARKGYAFPIDLAEQAVETINDKNHNPLIGDILRRFFINNKRK